LDEILYLQSIPKIFPGKFNFGISSRRPGFSPRPVHVGFVMDMVALGQIFPPRTWFSLFSVIPPFLHTYISFTYHKHLKKPLFLYDIILIMQYLFFIREGSEGLVTSSSVTLPTVRVESIPLYVEMNLPAHGWVRTPMAVSYHIHNYTAYLLELELNMEASDAFMFAGHKQVYHCIIKQINITRMEVVIVVLLKIQVWNVVLCQVINSQVVFDYLTLKMKVL
jgi:hypothetical protein